MFSNTYIFFWASPLGIRVKLHGSLSLVAPLIEHYSMNVHFVRFLQCFWGFCSKNRSFYIVYGPSWILKLKCFILYVFYKVFEDFAPKTSVFTLFLNMAWSRLVAPLTLYVCTFFVLCFLFFFLFFVFLFFVLAPFFCSLFFVHFFLFFVLFLFWTLLIAWSHY